MAIQKPTQIQWENLSAGALGILTSHNIDSRDTLTSNYHLLAESDVDVLVEEHVMDATDKEVWTTTIAQSSQLQTQ